MKFLNLGFDHGKCTKISYWKQLNPGTIWNFWPKILHPKTLNMSETLLIWNGTLFGFWQMYIHTTLWQYPRSILTYA